MRVGEAADYSLDPRRRTERFAALRLDIIPCNKGEYKTVEHSPAFTFRERYLSMEPDISLEVSTSGKHVARKLRDMGFSVHLADPVNLALIFNTAKKNDREDSYKLAKLLRLGELPEVHLLSSYSDDLRSLVRYRRSLGEIITMLKNRVHAILASAGISIDATDIYDCPRQQRTFTMEK